MRLHVDDFGCVPDGRVLERVAIAAGSAVLTDPDGNLRETDISKNIAIPGAADLVATIARLVDRKDVEASMTAGQDTLTASFRNASERFRADLHTGHRIVVCGAGPAGQPLLTDVEEVVNPTTLRLADRASTTVEDVAATLNRPNVVGLSNYARRSVTNVSVDLGDRLIDDARMTIGGRALESRTAKFSRLDLNEDNDVDDEGKSVTVPAAGLFVTIIQSVDSPTQPTLAAPAQRTVEEVLADVWKTDSRPGLELLLASLDSRNIESAEICFGSGVYDFTRIPVAPGAQPAAIGLTGLRNLTFRGSGPGTTILRLLPAQNLRTDTHVIETVDCRNLTFRDLSVHGAYLTLGNAVEQMHGFHINEGSEEITLQRVRVFQSAGDGVNLLGRPGRKVRKIWVESCRFIQNKRTGVGFQRAVEFVWVRNCYIEMTAPSTDQCVDFEPTGGRPPNGEPIIVAPTDIIIESNVLVHEPRGVAVAISGARGSDPTRRVKFANNIVLGGEVFCTDVAELTIQHNVVLIPASDRPGRVLLNLQQGGDSVLITGNLLISEHDKTTEVINLSESRNRQLNRALVAGNLCVTPAGHGIRVTGGDDVAVEGNMLVATGVCIQGVHVHSETSAVNGISVRNNDIIVNDSGSWATGILFSGDEIHHVCAVGNSLRGATNGIEFRGSGFRQTPVCALNRTEEDIASPLVGLGGLPEQAIVVGGAA
ncbi:MAG: hypothetical protein ACRDRA_01880, partial [Pseudonocardiaceae bacterium]